MKITELNAAQLQAAEDLAKALADVKLTNPYLRAGILAVVGKESGFEPRRENSYRNTPAARIRNIFRGWFPNWTDAQIDALKQDDRKFFNHVYSNNKTGLGNLGGDDGWSYRGGGYNQLTGRANFTAIGKRIGVDLAGHPGLITNAEVAAKACAVFFYDCIVAAQGRGLFIARHSITRTAEITSVQQGARVAHDANGGFNILPENDPTGGWQVVQAAAPGFYDWIISKNL